ncbi:MAG: ferredoxin, partial [Thermoproteota archaeon]|nr:ferredoxin [Thermoproteota archaeon]
MSLLLKDRVYTMESQTAKRGVYPLHGFKLGLYRLPFKLDDPLEIKSIHDGLKKAFEMEIYADRIFATYHWSEENMSDQFAKGYEKVDLNVTVEIVTGDVVDIIYQIWPIDKFGDPHWLKDYRKKADHFAKMVTDTILRNTILEEKFRAALMKTEKISEKESIKRLEELTPLAMIVLNAKPKPKAAAEEEIEELDESSVEVLDGAKPGPIDVDYKSKMKQSPSFEAETGHEIKTWG